MSCAAELWIGDHPLIEAIADNLTAYYGHPPDRCPWGKKDRTGWFGASSLKSKKNADKNLRFDPRQMILEYLGLAEPHAFNDEMSFGTFFDMVTEAAMKASPLFAETQPQVFIKDLRLRCTPDFLIDALRDDVYGDVKAIRDRAWRWAADPNWDIGNAYYYRQFQAVMAASHTDRFYLLAYERHDDEPFALHRIPPAEFRRRCLLRVVERDEDCIAGIRADLERCCTYLERALAVQDDPDALEAVLLPLVA